jgi:hypothetical protein
MDAHEELEIIKIKELLRDETWRLLIKIEIKQDPPRIGGGAT